MISTWQISLLGHLSSSFFLASWSHQRSLLGRVLNLPWLIETHTQRWGKLTKRKPIQFTKRNPWIGRRFWVTPLLSWATYREDGNGEEPHFPGGRSQEWSFSDGKGWWFCVRTSSAAFSISLSLFVLSFGEILENPNFWECHPAGWPPDRQSSTRQFAIWRALS